MVEHNIHKVLFHPVYAVLKLMVDLDQLVIVIIAVANHQGLGIPSLQILKSNSRTNVKYTMRSTVIQLSFILNLIASLRSLPSLFTLQ